MAQTNNSTLRLWPGVVIVGVQWLLFAAWPIFDQETAKFGLLGGIGLGLLVLLWWIFFSRAPWIERLAAPVLMALAVIANVRFLHESLVGAIPTFAYLYPTPVYCLALVLWAMFTRGMAVGARGAALIVAALLACVPMNLLRIDGFTGDFKMEFGWRWSPNAEERLLAQAGGKVPAAVAATPPPALAARTSEKAVAPAATTVPEKTKSASVVESSVATPPPAVARTEAIWPGFRGPHRDGVIPGVRIATDWSAAPPVQLWRRAIGPGWSSFAVDGDLLYTQEQRGEYEVVSCYRLSTGEPVWQHRDAARFYEMAGGAGPRATPALSNGRVYTLGATGIVNALDARDGSVKWTRNVAADTGARLPGWGFAGSPLVVKGDVVVAASGRLVAYDIATGNPRWTAQTGGGGYSSPQLVTLGGAAQILLPSSGGLTSLSPADGKVLWQHALPASSRIVQPAQTLDGDIIMTLGDGGMGGEGLRRIAITQGSGGWMAQERWSSRGLKPSFSDFVAHNGHAYGFDGSILACIEAKDGTRKWKGGRYGNGQLVLLPDQDLLLVVSEEGELVLVSATPDKFTEVARFAAIEGKTWNHPVLIGDVLLVRNGQEMVAFRLSLAEAQSK